MNRIIIYLNYEKSSFTVTFTLGEKFSVIFLQIKIEITECDENCLKQKNLSKTTRFQ